MFLTGLHSRYSLFSDTDDLHEGDLVLSEKLKKLIDESSKKAEGRDILSYESMRWPTKVIPYVFDPALSE